MQWRFAPRVSVAARDMPKPTFLILRGPPMLSLRKQDRARENLRKPISCSIVNPSAPMKYRYHSLHETKRVLHWRVCDGFVGPRWGDSTMSYGNMIG